MKKLVGILLVFLMGRDCESKGLLNGYDPQVNVSYKDSPLNESFLAVRRLYGTATKSKRRSGIFVLPTSQLPLDVPTPWGEVEMPVHSYFAGFSPPKDKLKWNQALQQASRGEQVLLSRVLQVIRSPFDLWLGDVDFKWVHRIAEYHVSTKNGWLSGLPAATDGQRAPIVMLGFSKFDRGGHEGRNIDGEDLTMNDIVGNRNFKIPRKIIAVGRMNENFGFLSTYFLNRSFPGQPNGFSFDSTQDPFRPEYKPLSEQTRKFLDDPNLVMLVVSQHHNISHPKVISLPLGITEPRGMWKAMQRAAHVGTRKDTLFYSAGSNWGFRPAIRACISKNLGSSFSFASAPMSKELFRMKLIGSMAVLAMPGMGYDTYRLWESLAAGAMPVVERGMGMDRTFYKLPVLLLDDYAGLTEKVLRQAYVEALYRADEWEYARMTKRWYEHLIFEVSEKADVEPLLRLHPMSAEDATFTRPLVPFTCSSGCGPGTKRTPEKSCAIDPSKVKPGYNWYWSHKAIN